MRRHCIVSASEFYFDIAEVEFYLWCNGHADPFVHRNEQQAKIGQWYFHRETSAKKSFTLKGVDLTFGQPSLSYGGILIRALRDSSGNIIDGPSKVVNAILDSNGVESVIELKADFDGDAFTNPLLRVERRETPLEEEIWRGPRIGLKAKATDRERYHLRPYRFRMWTGGKVKNKRSLAAVPARDEILDALLRQLEENS